MEVASPADYMMCVGRLSATIVRDAVPSVRDLARAEFATIRLRLMKVAVRVEETARRVKLAFAVNCPEADLFRGLAGAFRRPAVNAASP